MIMVMMIYNDGHNNGGVMMMIVMMLILTCFSWSRFFLQYWHKYDTNHHHDECHQCADSAFIAVEFTAEHILHKEENSI